MRVLLINTSEKVGGASIACNRLMAALNNNGIKAKMLVRNKQTDSPTVTQLRSRWSLPLKFVWERLVIYLNNGLNYGRVFQADIANAGTDITAYPEFKEADIVHLHWVNQGFLSLSNLNKILHSGKKIVITLHDQWYFTGICHYSAPCSKYETQCTHCELIGDKGVDLARRVFDKKKKIYSDAPITFVGCSRWMADMARKSVLTSGHQVTNIPNAIDTDTFCPTDRPTIANGPKWDENTKVILFGAQRITDERKGFKYFVDACNIIKECKPELAKRLAVVVMGGDGARAVEMLPFESWVPAYVSDVKKMVDIYNMADMYVTPSLQDNLPNTIVEAMACGKPCVGFNVGGIPEMIDHEQNGYVADYKNAESLAQGIMWTLDDTRYPTLCKNARQKAIDTYGEEAVARKYKEVYDDNNSNSHL